MLFKGMILLALLVMFTGCDGRNGDLEEITLVLDWTPNTNHTGFFAAMERGYFEEEGIYLNIIQPPEDGALILVAAGHGEFGISFQEEVLLAANNANAPLPIVAVAALVEHNTSGILSLAEHGITRFRDLEGMRFGSWMIPIYDEMIRESIRLDGGDPNLVEFVPHMALDNITGIQREFEAAWVFEGWDRVMADQMGIETNFSALRDINPVFDYYTPVLVTHENNLNTEMLERFMRASARGFAFARDNPTQAADILHQHAPEMGRDLLVASQKFLSTAYFGANRWGYIDSQRWNAFFYWMRDHEFIPADSSNPAFVNINFE